MHYRYPSLTPTPTYPMLGRDYKVRWVQGRQYKTLLSFKIFADWDFCIQETDSATLKQSRIRNDLKQYNLSFEVVAACINSLPGVAQRALYYILSEAFATPLIISEWVGTLATVKGKNKLGSSYTSSSSIRTIVRNSLRGHSDPRLVRGMGLNMRVQGEILFILAFACKVFETTGNTTLYSEAATLDNSTSEMKVYTTVQSSALDISTSGINADYSSPAITLGPAAPQSQTPDPNTYITGSSTSEMKVYTSVQSTALGTSTSTMKVDPSSQATTLVPVEDVTVESDPPSAKVWEGERLTLTCNAAKGNRLRYEWHFKRKTATMKLVTSGRSMTIHRVLENQAGNYSCVANNNLTAGHSQDIEVEVKVPVSVPRIWYSVQKQVNNYRARITCEAERGSPPVTFTLLGNRRKIMNNTGDLLNVTFVLPITLDQNMGIFTCQAENGKKPVHSVTQTVSVARVRGVSLESRPHPLEVSVNEEMVFTCSVEEGTFPVYKWMFNGHHLQANPDSYSLNQQGNILTIPSATLVHNGTYVCSVCDAFDKTHCIKSAALQAEVKEVVAVSIEAVAVVFCCFLFLVIVLSVCCVVAFKYRTGEYYPNSGVGMEKSAIWDKDMDEQLRDCSMDNSDLESVTKM
ncbi:platelet endothelial cell adhesion molecule-like isoform X4 [Acipenser ruthenus]|uniref:platelet endothelial cell adhesion molecule-like isoform X4 n=1 Tax=Acipenser ruthenus TaxID=7906 RepID=UPI002740EB7E|nr:platelet endothelial cell adhesion molecule-like isoform X4 [Acipenser ruthenus]